MSEPATHAAIGLSLVYGLGKAIGLNPDFLIAGFAGALFAIARQESKELPPLTFSDKVKHLFMALLNLCGISFLATSITTLLLLWMPKFAAGGVPAVIIVSFFGQPLIVAITEAILKGWKARLGVPNDPA